MVTFGKEINCGAAIWGLMLLQKPPNVLTNQVIILIVSLTITQLMTQVNSIVKTKHRYLILLVPSTRLTGLQLYRIKIDLIDLDI